MKLNINKEDHFKLYVLIQDRFTFEKELLEHGIEYYSDIENQLGVSESIRYYFKTEDQKRVDEIIVKNGINSGNEITGVTNYNFNLKGARLIIAIILGIMVLLFLFLNVLSNYS